MSREPRRIRILAVAGLLLVAVAAFLSGRVSAGSPDSPSTASAAAGFARDMQVHHDQGVELAMIIRELSEDEQVRQLAYDVATSQSQQSGQLYSWLEVWDLPQAPTEEPMAWMALPTIDGSTSHAHDADASTVGQPMPGLATPAEFAQLRSLDGPAADAYFLELMIAHHEGALEMAEAVLDRASVPVVVNLATSIIKSQSSEIQYMEALQRRI